ncbi:DUF6444 domain-containing protein, partial [Aeromonas caviae]
MTKKKSKFSSSPPIASDINEANALISELWEQLRHYEDRLQTSSANSSKSPSSDGPKERAERKKLKALVVVSIHRNSIDTGKMRRSSLDPTFLLA